MKELQLWNRWSVWKTDWLHMPCCAVSGCGERVRSAFAVLATVWLLFVLLYTCLGFAQQPPNISNDGASSASMTIQYRIGQPLGFSRALHHSLVVMRLQKSEPKPLTGAAQTLVPP
jgi:hypothetical protein